METRSVLEPLEESAPLALEQAPARCAPLGCAWYHGIWQYLRILDVVSAPSRHGDFFSRTLSGLAKDGGFPRVLITGSADYSMLAHLLAAYEGAPAEVTVLDVCATPLFLCDWYVERQGSKVVTRAVDVLEYAPDRPFDLICTHSFLSRFEPDRRAELMAGWHRLLRLGGKVVTNTRLDPAWTDARAGFTADQARAFAQRVADAARAYSGPLPVDADAMAAHARRYAERYRTHSFRAEAEVRRLLEGGGFALERLETVTLGDGAAGRGPTTNQAATYLEIVAVRRD